MAKRKSRCQQCGQGDDVAGRISKRGLCARCGVENMQANAMQMAAGSGPAYNLYIRRQRAGVEAYQRRIEAAIDARARLQG